MDCEIDPGLQRILFYILVSSVGYMSHVSSSDSCLILRLKLLQRWQAGLIFFHFAALIIGSILVVCITVRGGRLPS